MNYPTTLLGRPPLAPQVNALWQEPPLVTAVEAVAAGTVLAIAVVSLVVVYLGDVGIRLAQRHDSAPRSSDGSKPIG